MGWASQSNDLPFFGGAFLGDTPSHQNAHQECAISASVVDDPAHDAVTAWTDAPVVNYPHPRKRQHEDNVVEPAVTDDRESCSEAECNGRAADEVWGR